MTMNDSSNTRSSRFLVMTTTILSWTTFYYTEGYVPKLLPVSRNARTAVSPKTKSASLCLVPDPSHIDALTTTSPDIWHHVLSTSSTWLSDAAVAVGNSMGADNADVVSDLTQGLAEMASTIADTAGNVASTAQEGTIAAVATPDVAMDAAAEAATKQDIGWWGQYINIFENALSFVHDKVDGPLRENGVTQTWGVSIALFTFMVRSLLVPLSIEQSKSTEYMKALRPYMTEIKNKFKDNQDAQNRAIGKLYEDANQNPLAGCLFSLATLPVFLGLYRGIRNLAQDGKLREPFLFIPSLEGPVAAPTYRGMDWLLDGWTRDAASGLWTPSLGWETTLAFLIMPVVLVLGQSVTMKVLQPPVDDNMSDEEKETMEKSQVVLKFLPLLIGFFSLQVPAGLTIYWFSSNLFTLTQSLAVRSYYAANPPQIELPEYWDSLDGELDELDPETQRKAAEAGIAVGPKMEDLLDEARFHVVTERTPLRAQSAAWERVQKAESTTIPTAMEAWAGPKDEPAVLRVEASNNNDALLEANGESTPSEETQEETASRVSASSSSAAA